MEKTIALKKEFLSFSQEISYSAFSELSENLVALFHDKQLRKLSISYTKTDIGMNFLFEANDMSRFNINLTKGLFMKALIENDNLNNVGQQILFNIGTTFMENSLLNNVFSEYLIKNKKTNSIFSEKIEIYQTNLQEQIKVIMGDDYQRYEKDYLNKQISESHPNSRKLKV
jgi:hypothetical protein